MYMRKAYRPKRQAQIVRMITAWFLLEHRKSCDRKTSAQSNQKMVFKRITPHSPVNRNFFVYLVLYDSGHAQLDCAALVLFCIPYDQGQVGNISGSLIRKYVLERLSSNCLIICQCSDNLAEKIPFNTYVKYISISDSTAY